MRVEERFRPAQEELRVDARTCAEGGIALARGLGGGRERMIDPGGPPMRPRLVPGARGTLRVAGDQMGRRHVGANLAREDGLQDLLHARRGPRARHPQLQHLPGALQQHLVGIDVAERHLPEQPICGGAVALIDGAERRHVQRAVGERSALERDLFEEEARGAGPRLPQRQRLDEPHLRVARSMGRELRVADGGACFHGVGGGVAGERILRRRPGDAEGRYGQDAKTGDHPGARSLG